MKVDLGPGLSSEPPGRHVAFLASILVLVLSLTGCSTAAPEHVTACEPSFGAPTVARMWNERALDAIRRDIPDPTIAARNLYHLSVAMWDAFVLGGGEGQPILTSGITPVSLTQVQRDMAISVAAYEVLSSRYLSGSATDRASRLRFGKGLEGVCLQQRDEWNTTEPSVLMGLGVANAVLEAAKKDGASNAVTYRPVNQPLVVSSPGTTMSKPQQWQPLSIKGRTTQTGVLQPEVQEILGGGWGHVSGFALRSYDDVAHLIPDPPRFGTTAFQEAIVAVLSAARLLQLSDSRLIDISPRAMGNNSLGKQDGTGYGQNPATGRPYSPLLAREADYGRAIADYWADGPGSETPPGHWNVLANYVSDTVADDPDVLLGNPILEPGDRLKWDLALYVALNAALHDAAISSWGAKAVYDYARPISMIRFAGQLGQSTHKDIPNFDPDGLLLKPGVIEIISIDSVRAGNRHEHLQEHIGEIAVHGWRPGKAHPQGHIDWTLAVNWLPFQLPTFVSPAFPGYVSGHSTFSRAAAEVLARFTGSPYFPNGLYEEIVGQIDFAPDPIEPLRLQWATYFDAADQAGDSRIWGGIHIRADDLYGRILGAEVGSRAFDRFVHEFLSVPH